MIWAILGCLAFGMIVNTIGALAADDMTGIPLGAYMVIFTSIAMIILYGAMLMQTKFDLFISMGGTRKKVVLQYAVFLLISVILFWVAGMLCVKLEQFFHQYVLKIPPEGAKIYSVSFSICAGLGRIYLVEAGLAVLVAAASLRWGKYVWWIFYAVFLIACQVPNIINLKVKEQNRDSLYLGIIDLLSVTDVVQWLVCIGIALVFSALGWMILRRQRVTL